MDKSSFYVVGLAGKAGVGKDSIGDLIATAPGWRKEAFADPLRAMLVAGGFATEWDLHSRERKETPLPLHGRSPRYLMQSLGTEWARKMVMHDIWIRLLDERVDRIATGGARGVVVTDVRFEDEAAYIRRVGGRIVHVERPHGPRPAHADHVSEKGIRKAYGDITLMNDGSAEELVEKVSLLMREITGNPEWPSE